MIGILQSGFLFVLIILTFYSAELVWRERTTRVHEVIDALPVPNWALWGAKVAALLVLVAALLATTILTGMGIQASRGYYDFEVGLYLRGMFLVTGVPFLLMAILAVFLQVVTDNRSRKFRADGEESRRRSRSTTRSTSPCSAIGSRERHRTASCWHWRSEGSTPPRRCSSSS